MSSALQFIPQNPAKSGFPLLNYRVARSGDIERETLENTVREGFARRFGADVHSFMPLLSAFYLPESPHRACVFGLRRATDTLFIESYLPFALEHYLAYWQCSADEVFELGNLVSNHPLATLTHFVIMADALFRAGGTRLVFCATDEVRRLLARIGMHCQVICEAGAEAVAGSKDNWGSYYEHQPKVCLVRLDEAAALIAREPTYAKLVADNSAASESLLQEVLYI